MNFISEDFHLHYIASYTLYIQSGFKNDYLVVLDGTNEVLVCLHSDNLNPSADLVKFLSYPFANVIVGMPHQNVIWVPTDVFDESEKHLFTAYFLDEKMDSILVKEIEKLKVTALYQYDSLMVNRWSRIFPELKLVPNFEILMQQAQSYICKEGDFLGIHLSDNQADVFLFVNGDFKLYNTFEIHTEDDLSYFVTSIKSNFSIEGKFQRIMLSGVSLDSEWGDGLRNFTNDLLLLEARTNWNSTNEDVKRTLKRMNILADTILCV